MIFLSQALGEDVSAAQKQNSPRRLLQINCSHMAMRQHISYRREQNHQSHWCVVRKKKSFFRRYLLVELQVKDEGLAKGFHGEAALSQMNGLIGERKERWRQDETISSFISCEQSVIEISTFNDTGSMCRITAVTHWLFSWLRIVIKPKYCSKRS